LKNAKYLIFGAGALAVWYFLGRMQLGKRVKLLFRRIRLIGKGLSKQIELNFEVQNPTNQTGTISALTGEVLVNNQIVADFSSFGEQKIAPRSSSALKIIASPSVGILQLLTTRGLFKAGINYTIKGTGNFDGIIAPFEYTAKLI
jgi:hypothetical protein